MDAPGRSSGTAFCASCGTRLAEGVRFCPACGAPAVPVQPVQPPRGTWAPSPGVPQTSAYGPLPGEKNPLIAVLLSIVTGLGQFYNGELEKGVVFLLVGLLLWGVAAITAGILCIVSIPFWVYGLYDAYTRANLYNQVLRTTGRPAW